MRAPGNRGLPVKTFDGQVVFQHPRQRKSLKEAEAARGGADMEEEEEGAVGAASAGGESLPVAGVLRVAGVTIDDSLEETMREEAEAGRRAEEEQAQRARERKAQQQRLELEQQEGEGGGQGVSIRCPG